MFRRVELMPVTAWIDERHLPPLGLTNAWGYNPVSFMALDPRLAPGGWRNCARRSRRCARRASASSSTWSSTIPARATSSARRCRCAGSTTAPTTAIRRPWQAGQRHGHGQYARLRPSRRAAGLCWIRSGISSSMPAWMAFVSISRRCWGAGGNGFDPDAPLLRRDCRRTRFSRTAS